MSEQSGQPSAADTSVVDQILDTFLQSVAATPDLEAVAARLRKTLLVDRQHSDAALRAALFDGAE